MDAIACESLLTLSEVESVMGTDVVAIGRRASSCYWLRGGASLQLVFNTSVTVPHWREELLKTYTDHVVDSGAELWAEPGGESVAAFGPGRGLIVHGLGSRVDAIRLLRLAIGRL